MPDDATLQRIADLALEFFAESISVDSKIEVKTRGNDADLYVDGVCRYQATSFEGDALGALERALQRAVERVRKGRS